MTKRLTVSGATTQRDIDRLLELSNDNQFGRNEAYYKLQRYEDLEERFSSIFENLTLDDFINIFLKYIQEDNEEIRTGKILTNEDADKWNRWKSLEKSDRLVELKIACGQKVYTDDKTYNHGFEEYRVVEIALGRDMTYVAQSKSGLNLIFLQYSSTISFSSLLILNINFSVILSMFIK